MNTPQGSVRVSPRHSLRWRLPVLISGLITLVLATFLWAAYRRVEATLVRNAGERALSVADQVARILDGRPTTDRMRQVGSFPELRRFLQTRSDEAREAARARLRTLLGTGTRRVEVWSDDGVCLIEIAQTGIPAAGQAPDHDLPRGSPPTAAGIGALLGSDHLVFSDAVAEIPGLDSSPRHLGYVRIRSTFVENPPGIFSRLVGGGAAVKVGNKSGGLWTDFSRAVPAPAVDREQRGVVQYRDEGGQLRLGAVSPIPATPWSASVDFPLAAVVAPARHFLNGMVTVGLVFVLAAALSASVLAARITTPLAELNTAAASVASGDFSRRVAAGRPDEIGQLARTFNAMAAEVQAGEAVLRKSEESYRRLFASNPHPMWVYDVETLRFLDVNTMAVSHYGYSRDEFLAMTIKDIRPEAEVPALLDNLAHLAPAVEPPGVWKHRKKNGVIIDVEISSHALHLNGREARVVLAHDVTERLGAQEALRESEHRLKLLNAELEERVLARTAQLEAANQELESFSYSVSHDLRAPLRHVQGYVEMLTADIQGQLSTNARRYLNTITQATVEMGELIDDLLSFSRIARVHFSEGRVTLDAIVRNAIADLEMATRGRDIVWQVDPLPEVIGDPSLLKLVYANLLGNAVKYSRRRDRAVIEIGCAGEEDGDQRILFVRDNGAGFDMRYAHKLFGVFQRLHTPDEFEGTGIGLAIVRRIVTRHGGRTWAEGQVDHGATVYFTLRAVP